MTQMQVLTVMLFQLAAVLSTKMLFTLSPSCFPFQALFSFVKVVYPPLKPFSSVWDDMEHLLFMYCLELQSNIKIFLVLTAAESRTLKDRLG